MRKRQRCLLVDCLFKFVFVIFSTQLSSLLVASPTISLIYLIWTNIGNVGKGGRRLPSSSSPPPPPPPTTKMLVQTVKLEKTFHARRHCLSSLSSRSHLDESNRGDAMASSVCVCSLQKTLCVLLRQCRDRVGRAAGSVPKCGRSECHFYLIKATFSFTLIIASYFLLPCFRL